MRQLDDGEFIPIVFIRDIVIIACIFALTLVYLVKT